MDQSNRKEKGGNLMALTFPSPEWVEEFKRQINLSQGYKEAGSIFIREFAEMPESLQPKRLKKPLSVSRGIMLDGNRSLKKSWNR